MTKASSLLSVFLICASVHTSWAQSVASQNAEEEAVRRQEKSVLLRHTLDAAEAAQKQGDLPAAAKMYESAWDMVETLGSYADAERGRTGAGFVAVRTTLAERAYKDGQYRDADAHLIRALKVDPNNLRARNLKRENDRRLAGLVGRTPSEATIALIPEHQTNLVKVGTLVQDGKLLWEMGKLDEAEAKLTQAIKLQPENHAAYHYLSLIKETRFSRETTRKEIATKDKLIEVERSWNFDPKSKLPSPNVFARTNLIHTGSGRQQIMFKLDRIILNEFKLGEGGVPLSEVVKELDREARARDPENKGLNFIVAPNLDEVRQQAIQQIDPATGQPLQNQTPPEAIDLNGVAIRLNTTLRNIRLMQALDAIVKTAERPIKYSIEDYAIVFSQRTPEPVQLYTRRFKVDPNTFLQGLESVAGQPFGENVTGGGAGGGGGGGGGAGGAGGAGGGSIFSVPRVFTVQPQGGQGGGGLGGGGGGGGVGGQGGGSGITGVTTTNLMANVQVLVRDFFRACGVDFPQTFVPGAGGLGGAGGGGGFAQQAALGGGLGGGPVDPGQNQKALFFNDRTGILFVRATLSDLDIIEQAIQTLNVAPPQIMIEAKFAEISQNDSKALGFDWFLGNFLMRNGGIGMQAGSASSYQAPPSAANPNGIFPGFPGYADAGGTPTLRPGTVIPTSPNDQKITSGVRNQYSDVATGDNITTPALATITGILTDPQFRVVIRALQQREGVDLISAPRVTTLSGRQAQVQVADIRSIVVNQSNGQGGGGQGGGGQGGFGGGGLGGGGGGLGNQNIVVPQIQINYTPIPVPFGPVLDVIPYVSADDVSIQMTIIPGFTEFLGYDDPGPFVPQFQAVTIGAPPGQPLKAALPLPRFRARTITTSAIVWDGQTVVLGGLISEDVRKQADKVPFLGDVPFLGRFFRSESNVSQKKNLMIFVTPTIIDPAGNRVHDPNNLPFDPNSVPTQASATKQ